jgi:hypothetical protein
MAGFMPAIHVLLAAGSDVDGRDKPAMTKCGKWTD